MPIFLAALGGMLLNITASLVGRILVALGIGVVAYKGMTVSIDFLKGQLISSAAGLPPEVLGMLSTLKVGSSMSIIISAMLARLIINGVQGDTVKRWVTK